MLQIKRTKTNRNLDLSLFSKNFKTQTKWNKKNPGYNDLKISSSINSENKENIIS